MLLPANMTMSARSITIVLVLVSAAALFIASVVLGLSRDLTTGQAVMSPFALHHKAHDSPVAAKASHHALCSVTRVHEEAHNLPEWIEYHHLIGVEKFFIHDDCSMDDTRQVLENYRSIGLVEPTYRNDCAARQVWQEEEMLKAQYNLAKTRCEFVMVSDLDEFVTQHEESWSGSLIEYLQGKDYVRLWWYYMGNDERIQAPAELVTEAYRTGQALLDTKVQRMFKHIVSTKVVEEYGFSHWPTGFKPGYKHFYDILRDVNFDVAVQIRKANGTDIHNIPFFLKHYSTKSLAEYVSVRASRKLVKGQAVKDSPWRSAPLKAWLTFQYNTTAICADFTQSMSRRTKAILESRPWKVVDFGRFYYHG